MVYEVRFYPDHPNIIHAQFSGLLSTQDFMEASTEIAAMLEGENGPFGLIVDFSGTDDFSENLRVGDLRNAAFNLPISIRARVAVSPPLMAWLVIGILNRVTRAGAVSLADDAAQAVGALETALGRPQLS